MVKTRATSASASVIGNIHGPAEQAYCPAISNSRRRTAPFHRPDLRCRRGSREQGCHRKSCRTRAQEVAAAGRVDVFVQQPARGPRKRSATSARTRSGSRRSFNRPMGRRRRGAPENPRRQETRPKRLQVGGVVEVDVTVEPLVQALEDQKPKDSNKAPEIENCSEVMRTARALKCNQEDSEPVESSRPEEGWTKDQEVALHNAYFLVRPSSKFWFEISKKVPGKTAKECFDRFYSSYPTPPAPQTRSQKQVTESPIRSISFSSPMSTVKSRHHLGRGKQVLLKAHQAVRHILRKHQVADGNYEADVFAAVERADPTISSLKVCLNQVASPLSALEVHSYHSESLIATPNHSSNVTSSGRRNCDVVLRSMSAKEKELFCPLDQSQSSTKVSVQGQLLSPEVLKTESNPGRLDRYLDMLHLRRVEKQKSSLHKGTAQGSCSTQTGLIMRSKTEKVLTLGISAARDAIVADVKEILRTALHQRASRDEITNLLHDDAEESSSLIFDE